MPNIFIAGDSIVYGKWDPEGGWVSRFRNIIDERYNLEDRKNILVYNLGVPGELVLQLADRLEPELNARIVSRGENILIISAGLNDSCPNNQRTGEVTSPEKFMNAYRKCIEIGIQKGCRVLALGLTPVNPTRSKGKIFTEAGAAEYDGYVSEVCREMNVPKIELLEVLSGEHFTDGLVDSAHPGGDGHARIAELVLAYADREGILSDIVS